MRTVIRRAIRINTTAMVITCLLVCLFPQGIARLFGCDEPEMLAQSNQALRVFALSFIPFCYIYVLMIVYKLYSQHRMALFISFALSLTVIPVLWLMSLYLPGYIWHSYLIAYIIEAVVIYILHKLQGIKFELKP